MKNYLDEFGVKDKRWIFLNGGLIENVIELSEKGFMLAVDNLPHGHTIKFILVDPAGAIKGYYDSDNEASIMILKDHIKLLVKDF